MFKELNSPLPLSPLACDPASRAIWGYCPATLSRISRTEWDLIPSEDPGSPLQPTQGENDIPGEKEKHEGAVYNSGHSLYQQFFFFCSIKGVGDIPGTGCIYVEVVVDRDSGAAFAKVYSARCAMNAVDILVSHVVPFFERKGLSIKEIHTRKAAEYCGLVPAHPFETFLATSHIQHLPMEQPGQPYVYLCEQFYRFLLKDFFPRALRKHFRLPLGEMQNDLDAFVEAYNAARRKPEIV